MGEKERVALWRRKDVALEPGDGGKSGGYFVRSKGKAEYVRPGNGTGFYSPADSLSYDIRESLKVHGLKTKDVTKKIQEKQLPTKLTGIDLKRAIATQRIRKHGCRIGIYKRMYNASRFRPLTEKQCDFIIDLTGGSTRRKEAA